MRQRGVQGQQPPNYCFDDDFNFLREIQFSKSSQSSHSVTANSLLLASPWYSSPFRFSWSLAPIFHLSFKVWRRRRLMVGWLDGYLVTALHALTKDMNKYQKTVDERPCWRCDGRRDYVREGVKLWPERVGKKLVTASKNLFKLLDFYIRRFWEISL